GLRLGRSGDPAGTNYPGHALQHPALPYRGGDTMTTGIAERERVKSRPKELASVRARLSALLKRGALHLTLLLITLIWLVPTVGLAITSFRPRPDISSSGWWTVLQTASLTLKNYEEVINAAGMGHAFLNSLYITIPATILPVLIASLAAFGFAWIPFPGRDWIFLCVVALLFV